VSATSPAGRARRVLVTGGAGFLGSHLRERLVADGASRARVIPRREATRGADRVSSPSRTTMATSSIRPPWTSSSARSPIVPDAAHPRGRRTLALPTDGSSLAHRRVGAS
jgi:nucleoside-diphosphate-sugar epimerase